MSGVELLLVGAAGAAGAVVRNEAMTRSITPLRGLLQINVLGALALGVLVAAAPRGWILVLGGGFLGALTSFSTWLVLADDEPWARAVLLPLGVGVLAATAGRLLGDVL